MKLKKKSFNWHSTRNSHIFKRLNENEYQPFIWIIHNSHNINRFKWILHKGHNINHFIWIIKKLNNDHLYVFVMNSTLTQYLNLWYQHKSVTKKTLYNNSALGYKESNVIITLYDILWLFCWFLGECTRSYCWYHTVNFVRCCLSSLSLDRLHNRQMRQTSNMPPARKPAPMAIPITTRDANIGTSNFWK